MSEFKVPFIRPCYQRFYKKHKKEILAATNKCHADGDYTLRQEVWNLEKNIARFVGTKYAVGVNSGTDAIFLSLLALGIGPGDEVITVSNTFVATIQAIVHTGATPILVDVKEDELINIEQVVQAITPQTKAIIPVQYTGAICDMKALQSLATKHNLFIVDDACQALGAVGAGTFGVLNCFSFNTAKLLGGQADGGMVTTNERNLYEKICLLRNHWNVHQLSVDRKDYPQPEEMRWAWKSRLSNVNAAFINVKFKTIFTILQRRAEIADAYRHMLRGLHEAGKLHLPADQSGRVWQEFHLRVQDRDKFAAHMKVCGVETLTRDVVPNHKMKGLGLEHWNLPVTEQLAREVIRLPLHEWLKDSEVRYVIKQVKAFYGK